METNYTYGNATSFNNSSYETGKIPSTDAPRIEDVDEETIKYCESGPKKNTSSYWDQTLKVFVLGDYSGEKQTAASLGLGVLTGVFNADIGLDVRDLVYDLTHISELENPLLSLSLDAVALLPVVGSIKYLKYADDVADIVKHTDDVADIARNINRTDNVIDAATNATKIMNAQSDDIYSGVRQASDFLKQQGVPRKYRKDALQSFDVRTISLKTAGENTYGLRFYGGKAKEEGRYLFETFSQLTNRENLALPYEWNSMSGIQQFQVREGATMITGVVAPQFKYGESYVGGATQWYIHDLGDLIKCQ